MQGQIISFVASIQVQWKCQKCNFLWYVLW